ncbi:MAG TPA: LysR family transcriptional regulator [Verrucomicrobiae bacterium]|nr:LysR family transcriptional regulator [Verrucomicrobiae bacterium]
MLNNIHQLELFYYVARHGGISRAVRHIPYGVQQPAVSRQILQLEKDLGQTLFKRRPFQLTAAGQELYDSVRSLFENVGHVMDKLRGQHPPCVRFGAAPMVLRDYLPEMLGRVRRRYPQLRFILKEGPQAQVEEWFAARQIDLAVMQVVVKPPPDCSFHSLLKLPVVLLVNERSSIRSAQDIWKAGCPKECLIGPWPDGVLARDSSSAVARAAAGLPSVLEVNSIELIEHYVRHGHGVGVSIVVPGKKFPPGLRMVPLPGEPCVEVGALWRGTLHPAAEALLRELKEQSRSLELACAA